MRKVLVRDVEPAQPFRLVGSCPQGTRHEPADASFCRRACHSEIPDLTTAARVSGCEVFNRLTQAFLFAVCSSRPLPATFQTRRQTTSRRLLSACPLPLSSRCQPLPDSP